MAVQMNGSPALLELQDVVVRRRLDPTSPRELLLDRVTCSVRPGETWALLGANGAGKTTLLRVASAELGPTSGSVSFFGRPWGRVRLPEIRPYISSALSVGRPVFHPAYSVLDVVLTGATGTTAILPERVEQDHVDEAHRLMDACGVSHVARRRFDSCSQGERARALLARTLLSPARLVLLDEPAAGLDLRGRELLLSALAEIRASRRQSLGIVIATHHLEELPTTVTHALLLRAGQVVSAWPIDEALTNETATRCFRIPVQIRRSNGRVFAWADPSGSAAPQDS